MLNGFGLTRRDWSGRDDLGLYGAGRGGSAAPFAGGASSSETRPKMLNRFWDGYAFP